MLCRSGGRPPDIHSVSQIFAAVMFVDDCGTKNPLSEQLVSMRAAKLKAVKILGREINFVAIGSPTQAKVYGEPGTYILSSLYSRFT
jgi:hypothetical protein